MKFERIRAKDLTVGMKVSVSLCSFPQEVKIVEHNKKAKVVLWSDDRRMSLIGSLPENQWVNVEIV
jgi:hypothetical protein